MAKQLLFPDGTIIFGKCYDLTVTIGGYVSPITFTVGDFLTQPVTIGTATANGNTTFSFTATADITYLVMEYTDTAATVFPDLRLDIACADSACSQCFTKYDNPDCVGNILVLEWTNDNNAFGFDYTTSSFAQVMAVKGIVERPTWQDNNRGVYNSSNGLKFQHYTNTRKQQEMFIDQIPDYMHEALSIGLVHDHFYINGTEYIKVEDTYEPDFRNNSFLAPVLVPVEEKTQNLFNRNC